MNSQSDGISGGRAVRYARGGVTSGMSYGDDMTEGQCARVHEVHIREQWRWVLRLEHGDILLRLEVKVSVGFDEGGMAERDAAI